MQRKIILILLLCWAASPLLYPQYLRDSTRLLKMEALTHGDEASVLKLYAPKERIPLTLDPVYGIPEVEVQFGSEVYPFFFDFGNSGNMAITTQLQDQVDYTITDTSFTYTPDGQVRGQIYRIRLPRFTVFGKEHRDESSTLMDWKITSSDPYNGLVGLKYLQGTCFTLSYAEKQLAVSREAVWKKLPEEKVLVLPLENYRMHPWGVHVLGQVEGREAVLYFDTGKSVSMVNRDLLPEELIRTDKSGSFYAGVVEVVLGDQRFEIYYPRVRPLHRDIETDVPVGIELGSDILQHFLLTIDRSSPAGKLVIHKN